MTAGTPQRPKPYSTKKLRPPAPEFEQMFVMHGWSKVSRMYGKRCSQRWFIALGPERLRKARDAYKEGTRG